MFKVVSWTLTICFFYSSQLFALSNNYYSETMHNPVTQSDPDTFRQALHENLTYYHVKQANHQPDLIKKQCPKNSKCYKHQPLHYSDARIELLGNIHLEHDGSNYFIQTLYCRKKLSKKDFNKGRGPAPGRIPDHRVLNTEHMWPQSRFSRNFPKRVQKSDLHSLYPAGSVENGKRGNLPFAEVSSVTSEICANTKLGSTGFDSRTYLDPTVSVRGDIARALFYFSVRYKIRIDSVQEEFFRKWHIEDPVSEKEIQKNEMVFEAQKNRNPFIDHPEWVNIIQNF